MIEVQQPRTSSSSNCKGNDLGALDFKDFSGFFNVDRRRFCFQGKFPTFGNTENCSDCSVLLTNTKFVFPPKISNPSISLTSMLIRQKENRQFAMVLFCLASVLFSFDESFLSICEIVDFCFPAKISNFAEPPSSTKTAECC